LAEPGDRRSGGPQVGARTGSGGEVLPAVSGGDTDWHGGYWELSVVCGADDATGACRAGWGCGEDSRQRFTAAEARQAGCTAACAIAGGRSFSGDLGAFERTEGSTAVADPSPQIGTRSRAGEERAAASGDESRRFEEAEVVEPSGREGAPRVTACALGQPAARRPVQGKRDVEWAD